MEQRTSERGCCPSVTKMAESREKTDDGVLLVLRRQSTCNDAHYVFETCDNGNLWKTLAVYQLTLSHRGH